MVPHRGPYGSSALLPYEVAIEQVGLTVEEYKEFQQLAAAYKAERAPGYERIPDVRNEVATILAVTSLVIGVASTAAALLMKPKPPEAPGEREPTNFEGGDNVGKENFSPRYGFDSVQTLATLGKVIPLIFGHRNRIGLANHTNPTLNDRVTCGGIRIDTQLVWSALVSKGRTQELRIAALLGANTLGHPYYESMQSAPPLESIPQDLHLRGLLQMAGGLNPASAGARFIEKASWIYLRTSLTICWQCRCMTHALMRQVGTCRLLARSRHRRTAPLAFTTRFQTARPGCGLIATLLFQITIHKIRTLGQLLQTRAKTSNA